MLTNIRFNFENTSSNININHSSVLKTDIIYIITSNNDIVVLSGFNRPRFLSREKKSLLLITLRMKTSFSHVINVPDDENKRIIVSIK